LIHFYKRYCQAELSFIFAEECTMDPDTDYVKWTVHQYLAMVAPKLAKKFKKEANLVTDLPPGSPALVDIVQHYNDTARQDTKRKASQESSDDSGKGLKKVKKMSDGISNTTERKRIFIRNVNKESVYEDFEKSVEKFGTVTDFSNPGRGFCFLTFSTGKSAKDCVAALNKTEVAGKVVLMNISREESESDTGTAEGCKLFVHGVKQEIDEDDIKSEFEVFGKVVDSFNPGKGFAFVTFSLPEEASAAAEGLDGKEVFGSNISVNVSKPKVKAPAEESKEVKTKKSKKEKNAGIRLFVNNVSEDTSQEDLKKAFDAYGTVTDVYNPGKGFAFVNFSTENEANAAIEALNGKEVCGKEVECNIARFKKKIQKGRAKS